MKQIFFLVFILALSVELIVCQKHFNKNKSLKTPISGCYSDTALIKNEGLVVGNGYFKINKANGQYKATFSELISDGGESAAEVKVRNLIINEAEKVIVFDLLLNSGILLHRVKGIITSQGIKMYWRKNIASEYGQPNPFMRRVKCFS